MKRFCFLLYILLVLSTEGGATTQSFNFTVENNSAINFENGSYIIEVIEISKSMYARVNVTFSGQSKNNYIFIGEAPILFGQIKVSSSSVMFSNAVINVEFPDGWAYPKIYPIVRPTAPVGNPNIIVTRTVDKTNLKTGDVLSVTIKVQNTGNATAENITMTELLPNGFSSAPGSRFPPVITNKLEVGESQELYYGLKAIDPGTYYIEPTSVNYGSKTAKSNPTTVTIAEEISNLTTVIRVDKNNVKIDDEIIVRLRVFNTGKTTAKSVIIKGETPSGLKVIEDDPKRYESTSITPGEQKEYRIVYKAEEEGDYQINLTTVYNENDIGILSGSEIITVTDKDINYLYLIIPIVVILIGFSIFTIRKHKEYKY